eukprot:m.865861 g.865861  ORF g.865861 m.865861 type:complete len:97 (-) comp23551_c0_seq38:1966-2256(-)
MSLLSSVGADATNGLGAGDLQVSVLQSSAEPFASHVGDHIGGATLTSSAGFSPTSSYMFDSVLAQRSWHFGGRSCTCSECSFTMSAWVSVLPMPSS